MYIFMFQRKILVNLTQEMTKDRNLCLSIPLRKKGDSIHPSRKSSFSPWNGLVGGKKFQETGKTCNQPGQGRKWTIWTKSERRTCDENETWIPKKSRVPHAKLSRVHWRMLLTTRVEIWHKCCWYLFRIIAAISISNKFSDLTVFHRELS